MNLLVVTEQTDDGHGCIAIAKNKEEVIEFLRERVANEICMSTAGLSPNNIKQRLSLEWDSDVICARWPTEAIVIAKLDSPYFFQIFTVETPPIVAPLS